MFWKFRKASFTHPPAPEGCVIYAVGDVHGMADLLAKTMAAIDEDFSRAEGNCTRHEVYLGDYIDRGPESAGVITLLCERLRSRPGVCCLKGNHEALLQQFLERKVAVERWKQFGGAATLRSYGVNSQSDNAREELAGTIPEDHQEFFRLLQLSHRLGDYLFVHAGIRPKQPIEYLTEEDALWIREEFLEYRQPFGSIVVHGHTPVEAPEFMPNRINIDTGAYLTQNLTCLRIGAEGPSILNVG